MKATICLTYDDESEVYFTFESYEDEKHALATLMMVVRGTLVESMAISIVAYDEEGVEICSYFK